MKRISSKLTGKAGFTLVELVVVIAVLAILAGVGAVAYNGYITYAKQGQDRATVGEIMHALELADYSDPHLFEEDESATIYLTANSGLKVLKARNQEQLEAAMEDALGDLSQIKLRYDGWAGTDSATLATMLSENAKLTELFDDSDSCVAQYIAADGTASFSANMVEYWGDVEKLVTAFNVATEGTRDTVLGEMINNVAEVYTESIKTAWTTNEAMGTFNSMMYVDLARTYAFCSYVENTCGDQYKDDLDKMKTEAAVMSIGSAIFERKYPNLVTLRDEYLNGGQAAIDVQAFIGLMEAGNTLRNADGTFPKDEDLMPLISDLVSAAAPVMNKSVSFDDLKSTLTGSEGIAIPITGTKRNGSLVLNVTPGDINPRAKASSTGTSSGGEDVGGGGSSSTSCPGDHKTTIDLNTLEITGTGMNQKATLDINLCLSSHLDSNKITLTYSGECTLISLTAGANTDYFSTTGNKDTGYTITAKAKTGDTPQSFTLGIVNTTAKPMSKITVTVNVKVYE